MTQYIKPLPQPTPLTAPFWEGARRHELLVQKCGNCGRLRFIPKEACPNCLSLSAGWEKVTGKGKVYTFTIIRRAPMPAFAPDVPYTVAVIELDEGPRMMTNIVGCKPEDVRIGMPVKVRFDDVSDTVTLPRFEPAR